MLVYSINEIYMIELLEVIFVKKRCLFLYLKKVEIHGFKSFADRTEIDFENGITGVVGPNGSGKSNVSDAIRWVLGEQSAKTLRGSKMEDIIFAGTTKRKPTGMAEVTLTLDNTSGKLPIDYSEVSVTRRVYRSGESEYYINKSLCRLKDIKEILMDTGIGIDGYSIIGQGRIDEILSNKSEDRRILFEEAAGIVKYKTRKEEAEKKLNSTNQNLVRVNDIIEELQARIEPLKNQSKKANEYIEIKGKLKNLEINLIVRELEQLKNNIETLKEQKTIIGKQLNEYSINKSSIDEKYNSTKIKLKDLEDSISQVQNNIYETLHLIDRKNGEITLCKEKINNFTDNSLRIKKELSTIDKNIGIFKTQSFEEKEKLDELNKELDIKKETLNSRASELEEVNNQLYHQEEEMEKSKSSVIELLNSIASKKSELNSLETLRSSLLKRQMQVDEELAQYNTKKEELVKKEENAIENEKLIEIAFTEKKEEKKILEQKIQESNSLIFEINKELENIKNVIQESKTRKKILVEMEKDYEGFNQSVKNTLIHGRKNPEIKKGIVGVVAELIQVPKGLEVAIEVALGGSMQNIVCYTSEDAKRTISDLKKYNFGRVTFLPLDNIKSGNIANINHIKNTIDGIVNTAIDSIVFSEQYKNIFEYLLGRVIIVDKIENGIKLARKTGNKYKIVSLEGDVINPGGSITGGSYRSKTTSILSRKREIEDIEKIIESQTKVYYQKKEITENYYLELESQNKKYKETEQILKEREIDLVNASNGKIQIQKELANINQTINRLEKEIKELSNDGYETKLSIENIIKQINEFEKHRDNIQDSTFNNKTIYDEQKTKKDKLLDEVTGLKISYAELKEKKHHMERNLVEILNKEESLASDRTFKINELDEIKKSIDNLQKNLEEIQIELKDSDVLKQQYEFNLSQMKVNKENLDTHYSEIEADLKKINEDIGELQESKHKIEMKLTRLETQQESHLNKLWEDYEISYMEAIEYKNNDININEASKHIRELRNRLKDIGNVNLNAIEEYKEVLNRHEFLTTQKEDLIDAKNSLDKVIEEMDNTMRIQFMESFEKIKVNFDEVFRQMFGGGRADIKLENEEDVLTTGIEIVAQPPGKKLQNLLLLSGGERALTAIALLFAILRVKPTPFCILDEIEAALDDANVYRFADFLKEFSTETQFIVVTHRKGTMEAVDVLYGITMQEEGISTLVSVKLTEKAS